MYSVTPYLKHKLWPEVTAPKSIPIVFHPSSKWTFQPPSSTTAQDAAVAGEHGSQRLHLPLFFPIWNTRDMRYRPSPPSRRHSPVSSCHIQASCQPNVRSGARYTSERQSGDGSGNGNVASLINYTRLHAGRRAAPLAGHTAMGAWPRERDTTSRACSAA